METKNIFIVLIVVIVVAIGAVVAYKTVSGNSDSDNAQNGTEKVVYKRISPQEAKSRMDANSDAIIVDVREPYEYEAGHIKNATLVPLGTIGQNTLMQIPDKNAELLIYCRSGRRSADAAKKFIALGYTNVYDFGGIISWPYEKE